MSPGDDDTSHFDEFSSHFDEVSSHFDVLMLLTLYTPKLLLKQRSTLFYIVIKIV